ncbi:hypothetical protein NESM_000398500 [Novymonas esmeraldas]|uniref:non-specific serine/threonine protein kinase n=1 Tax=Novymonas esmeraldas TaxID=1808958 RepID=A0AAW0EMU9_9TRYP
MIRKKVLSIGTNSATLLVQDTESGGALRVLRRVSVAGWADAEVSAAGRLYEELRRSRLRGFVPIHTVLVQSSFLSVVASYAAEGDVTTLIEEEESNPLEESSVLRWLCACALAMRQLHTHKLFFPGLSSDRLFLDHHTGGTANVLLGVPLPLPVYYAQLMERKRSGVRVELDYPPEVLAVATADRGGGRSGVGYHPTLSDVWCLGRLGVVLLTAKGTNMARRSGSTRQLLSRMMADEPATRPSMESVVQSLVALAGNVSLGQPPWPSQAAAAPVAASSAPPLLSRQQPMASPGCSSTSASPPPSTLADTRSTSGGGAGRPRHITTAASHGTPPSSHPPSSATSSPPPPELPSTRAPDSRRPAAVAPAPAAETSAPVPTAQASPPTPTRAAAALHRDPASARLSHAVDDSWHRRAGEKFEQLQRMNASPPKQHHIVGDAAHGEYGHHRLRGSTGGLVNMTSLSPRRNGRGTPVDNKTHLLDEMLAEQEELRRRAEGRHASPQSRIEDAQQLHRDNLRQLRLETAARQQEMRKHFTQWQRQNNQRLAESGNVEVIDHDGVVIVAPRPAPPLDYTTPPTEEEEEGEVEEAEAEVEGMESSAVAEDEHSALLPRTTLQLTTTTTATAAAALSRHATPTANAQLTRYTGSTPRRSYTPSSAAPGTSALRSAASPRAPPQPQLASAQPYPRPGSDLPGPSARVLNGDGDSEPRPGGRASADRGTLSAVEWSIDGIRSTLRTLLRHRDLYGETMQEVAMFVSQPEEARLAVRANEVFMKRLRKLLRDDAVFFGAAPLCAQLVALEGLDSTLRSFPRAYANR